MYRWPGLRAGAPGRLPGRTGPGGGKPGPTPIGRVPAEVWRVGCIGRRSPGRSGPRGAPTPGVAGRGRWKIGWPGTGRPGAGRAVPIAPACAAGAAGRGGGALYTGRGPVWGTIMRGAGGCTGVATGGVVGRGAGAGV